MTTDAVALVTGGGSGIGAALCRRLAANGVSVVVTDIDAAAADRVAGETGGHGLAFDVADRDAWPAMLAKVVDRFGRLDMVALNAGIMSRPRGEPAFDDPLPWIDDQYERVRSVNIDGVFHGIMATLPHLESTGGRIVCTASTAGLKPLALDPVYSMTKHAVIGLVRSMAAPLAERGVALSAVCPGAADTPIVAPDIKAALGRSFATADHIAAAIDSVLQLSLADAGGIWISTQGVAPWRYEFASADSPATD